MADNGQDYPWSPGEDTSPRPFGAGRPLFPFAPPGPTTEEGSPSPPPQGNEQSGGSSSSSSSPSPTGPNLRGSLNRDTQTEDQARTNLAYEIKKDPRLQLPKVPELFSEFPGWVADLEGKLLVCGIGSRKARIFMHEMNTWSEGRLKEIPEDEAAADLDAKLYEQVIGAMKGTTLTLYVTEFQTEIPVGAGRLAYRRLQTKMRFEAELLAETAEANLDKRTCANVNGLGKSMQETKYDKFILKMAGKALTDTSLYRKLLNALRPYKKDAVEGTGFHFGQYDAKDPAQRNIEDLILGLQRLASQHEDAKQKDKEKDKHKGAIGKKKPEKKQKGAVAQVDENGKCTGCGAGGHGADTCYKLHPELRPGPKASAKGKGHPPTPPATPYGGGGGGGGGRQGGKKGGKGKAKGAAANANQQGAAAYDQGQEQQQGKHPPCTFCGRTNHVPSECFYRPIPPGEQAKAGRAGVVQGGCAAGSANNMMCYPCQGPPPPQQQYPQPGSWFPTAPPPVISSQWGGLQPPPPPPYPNAAYWPPPPMQPAPAPPAGPADVETMAFLAHLRGDNRVPGRVARVKTTPKPLPVDPLCELLHELNEKDRVILKALAGLEEAVEGLAADTGASQHILDRFSKRIRARYDTPGAATIEAVGGDVPVDEVADFAIPGIQSNQKALLVEGSPDCASVGTPRKQGHTFHWGDEGAILYPPGAPPYRPVMEGTIELEVDNNVPYFPPQYRPARWKEFCSLGFTREVRIMESMSPEELEQSVRRFKATTEAYAAARIALAKAGVSTEEFFALGVPARLRAAVQEELPKMKGTVGDVDMKEEPEDEEEATTGKKRPKRLPKKKRMQTRKLHERGQARAAEDPLPADHSLLHQKDDRCASCIDARLRKYPAFSNTGEALTPGLQEGSLLVSVDMVKGRAHDFEKRDWYMATIDNCTRRPKGAPTKGKDPADDTWPAFSTLYQGSRIKPSDGERPEAEESTTSGELGYARHPVFPKQLSIDGDPAWKGPFKENVEKRGGGFRVSVAERSSSAAIIENWIEQLERGVAVSLLHAAAPIQAWSRAAHTFEVNYERTYTIPSGKFKGMTPHTATWGKEYTGELLPFGCYVSYLRKTDPSDPDARDKWDTRGAPAVFMTYATEGQIEVLDLTKLKQERTFHTLLTRDYQADPARFPFREMKNPISSEDAALFQFMDEEETLMQEAYKADNKGVLRCTICDLVSHAEPVRCRRCIEQRRHGPGRPSTGCRKGRCRGHLQCAVDDHSDEDVPDLLDLDLEPEGDAPPAAVPLVPPTPTTPARPATPTSVRLSTDAANLFPFAYAMAAPVKHTIPDFRKNMQRCAEVCEARKEDFIEQQPYLETIAKIKQSLGLVAKVYSQNSDVAKKDQQAQEAIAKEFKQLEDKIAILPHSPRSWAMVQKEIPDARKCELMMVVCQKNIESWELMRWKARAVARGDLLRGASGEKIIEDLTHVMPTSLELTRLCFAWEVMVGPDGITLQGDVPGAYLTAPLVGPRTFLTIPVHLRQRHWKHWEGIPDPVIEVKSGLYGLPRGDTCWGGKQQTGLRTLKMEQVKDVGEESFWLGRPEDNDEVLNTTMVSVYTDNFQVSGRRRYAILWHSRLMQHFGFAIEDHYEMTDVIGLEREPFYLLDGRRALFIHQTSYNKHMVETYEKKYNGGKELRRRTTPLLVSESTDHDDAPSKTPEITAADASSIGGAVAWPARCSRFDLCLPAKRIIQRIPDGGPLDAAMAHRTMEYVKETEDLGIVMYGDPSDRDYWIIEVEADTDHGNDPFSAKSTGAHWLLISGPSTHCPVSWGAKGQAAPGRSTAEVESTNMDRATFVHAMPLCAMMEQILRRPVRIALRGDNSAANIACRKGYSRKPGYIKKHQKCSLAAMRHVFVGGEPHEVDLEPSINMLGQVASMKNRSDLGTKALDHVRHWVLLNLCRMTRLRQVQEVNRLARF